MIFVWLLFICINIISTKQSDPWFRLIRYQRDENLVIKRFMKIKQRKINREKSIRFWLKKTWYIYIYI